jgi:hypothetical protein
MKRFSTLMLIMLILPVLAFGQLKKDLERPSVSNALITTQNNSLLGFLDPSKMEMSHSVSMSYMTFSGQGMMLNTYLNTMQYNVNEKFSVTTKLGVMNSPYNSFPNNSYLNESHVFGGAELRYRPSENSTISLRVESLPAYYNSYNYSPGSMFNSYYRPSLFSDDDLLR